MNYQNVANFEDFFATKHYLGTNQWHWISKEIAISILHLCSLFFDEKHSSETNANVPKIFVLK